MQSSADILLAAVGVFGITFAVNWIFTGRGMRMASGAASQLTLGNLWITIGVMLTLQRGAAQSYWAFQVADWLVLAGILMFRTGSGGLMRIPQPPWFIAYAPLLLAVTLTAGAAPDASSFLIRAVAFSAAAAWLAFEAWRAADKWLKSEYFPMAVRIAICWPFILVLAAMVFRLAQLAMADPAGIAALRAADGLNEQLLWTMLATLLAFNVSMMGLVTTRLLARIQSLASHDPLTGCWNRRELEQRLQQEHARHHHAQASIACVFFDIDNFKAINDRHGHAVGDQALIHTSRVATSCLRASDVLGRFGGEEFLVLLPDTALTGAQGLALRMQQALDASALALAGQSIPVTASFGVAQLRSAESVDEFLHRADVAMYEAKRNGKNRVEVAL